MLHTRTAPAALMTLGLLLSSAPTLAQTPPSPETNTTGTTAGAQPEAPPKPAPKTTMTVVVEVREGVSKKPVPNAPVFLYAARVKGPFEPADPKPDHEWVGVTDASGRAVFDKVPRDLAQRGKRLHAVTTYKSVPFKTGQTMPADGVALKLPVYEQGTDLSKVRVKLLRMNVVPWEGQMIFQQQWTLTVDGAQAINTGRLPDIEHAKGLPLALPAMAKGISARAPGEHEIIKGVVYWRGLLKPGEPVQVLVGFSMTAHDPSMVFRQTMAYPTEAFELMLPLETEYKKLPRLDRVAVRAPGFEDQHAGRNVPGFNPDFEMLFARKRDIKAGEEVKLKIEGLPYSRPWGPLAALALGLLAAAAVLVVARRDQQRRSEATARELRVVLERERDELLEEIVELERDMDEGVISVVEYERERALLRARTMLVLSRIEAFERGDAAAAEGVSAS